QATKPARSRSGPSDFLQGLAQLLLPYLPARNLLAVDPPAAQQLQRCQPKPILPKARDCPMETVPLTGRAPTDASDLVLRQETSAGHAANDRQLVFTGRYCHTRGEK